MTSDMNSNNNVHKCRTECQQMIRSHIVATADWLTEKQGIAPSKLFEMWSVLNIETELDNMKLLKQQTATKKAASSKQLKPKSQPTTPVKAPKTRRQKQKHTMLVDMENEAGTSNVSEHAQLAMIQKASQEKAFQENFQYVDMSAAKGGQDMARSMDLLQKVIMKPEWKDLTSGILHEQDITRKTQESVVAVANAIVVPLSLLIHAAGLPSDDIEQLKLVWKQALGMLGEKSVEKQSKGIQAARSDLTLKDLEELAKFDREVAQGLDDGQITPITKADVQLMKLKNKKVVQRAAFDFGDGDDDVEETPTDEAPEQSAPIIIEDSESVANVPKNTVVFTSTDQESSSDESSTEKDSNEKFNTAINEESSDLPEMRRLNEVSKLEKEGLSSKQILSKSVAKKGLTLLPNPCFRIKARKTRTKIQKEEEPVPPSSESEAEEDSNQQTQEQSGHDQTIGNYWFAKNDSVQQKRFMGSYYESDNSLVSEIPRWSPKVNLLELTDDLGCAMESLRNCLELELMNSVSIQEQIELINWVAFVRDGMLHRAANRTSIATPTSSDPDLKTVNEAYQALVNRFMEQNEKEEVARVLKNNMVTTNDDDDVDIAHSLPWPTEKQQIPTWMTLWTKNQTLREVEAKRDTATNICKIDDVLYNTRAPDSDDLFDVMLLTKEKSLRFEDGVWYLPDGMKIPDDLDTQTLSNWLKMSPSEIAECYPCLATHINPDFKWAVEGWYSSNVQVLATESNTEPPKYIPFCLTNNDIVASANRANIVRKENIQSNFFQNRNKSYLGRNWAERTGTKLPKATADANKRCLDALSRARNTARGQVVQSGVDLKLPAPVNRDFNALQAAWTSIIKPTRMAVFPNETVFDAVQAARLWAIEMESALFGEAVNSRHQVEEEENLKVFDDARQNREMYESVVEGMNINPRKLPTTTGKKATEKAPLSREEYDRLVTNCFNVHGLPKPVYNSIAKSVIQKVDKMMISQSKVNSTLRDFVRTECQKELIRKDEKGWENEFTTLKKRCDLMERTNKTLQKDQSENLIITNAEMKKRALVSSLQRLEEKYELIASNMAGDQMQVNLIFKIIDLCLDTPLYWAERVVKMIERFGEMSFLTGTRMSNLSQELSAFKDWISHKIGDELGIRDDDLTSQLGKIIAAMDSKMDQGFKHWVARRNSNLRNPLISLSSSKTGGVIEKPEFGRQSNEDPAQIISSTEIGTDNQLDTENASEGSSNSKETAPESTQDRQKRILSETLKKYVEFRSGQSAKKKPKLSEKEDSEDSNDEGELSTNAITRGDLNIQRRNVKKSNATLKQWKELNKAIQKKAKDQ